MSIPIRLALAKMFMAAKEFEQAHKRLVWVLEREPGNTAARGLLGSALAGMAQPDDAGHEADRVLEADPQNLQARVLESIARLGQSRRRGGRVRATRGRQTHQSLRGLGAGPGKFLPVGRTQRASRRALPGSSDARSQEHSRAQQYGLAVRARRRPRQRGKGLPQRWPISRRKIRRRCRRSPTITSVPGGLAAPRSARPGSQDQKDPTVLLRESLAEVYYLAGRRADAQKVAEELIKENNQDVRARLLKGMMHVNQQQYDDAVTEFTHVLYFQPDLVPAHYWLAVASMATNNEQVALQHMERALQLNKGMLRARIWIIQYDLDRGSKDAAFSLAREAPDSQQTAPELRLVRAICSADGQLSPEQQVDFQQAILAEPSLVMTYANRGLVPLLRQYGAAPVRDQLEAVVKEQSNVPAGAESVGEDFGDSRQTGPSARGAGEARCRKSQLLPGFGGAGKKSNSAMDKFPPRARLSGKPKAAGEERFRGHSSRHVGSGNDVRQSRSQPRVHGEDLTRKFPQSSEAWNRLAQVQDRRHATKEAQTDYEKLTLELNPRNAVAANNLAWLLASADDLKRAIELAKKAPLLAAHQSQPSRTPWDGFNIAWGDYPGAVQSLGEASRRSPDNPHDALSPGDDADALRT